MKINNDLIEGYTYITQFNISNTNYIYSYCFYE